MLDRRSFLGAGAAVLATSATPALAADLPADAALASMLQRHAAAFLRRSPEEATGIGLDAGANADLRGRLDDRSLAARATDLAAVKQAAAELARIDPGTLSAKARLDHGVAAFVYDTLADGLARPGYLDINLRPSPYVVSQMNGAYYWLPDFIGTRHPLLTRDDGAAWLARLDAFATVLDQETDRIRHDAGIGVAPPGFVIDRTIPQIVALRDGASESALIAPALPRAAARGLGDMGPAADKIFRDRIAPALDRQRAALAALRPSAVETAGVWRLPDGDALYAAALRANITTDIAPGELHRQGVAQCRELIDRIDGLLKAQGLSQGSVGARVDALNRDPRFLVSNDDAGRAKLIAAAETQIADITARLPRAFGNTSVRPIRVQRISPAIENGAPGALYSEGGEGEPGIYSLNLKSPGEHALWRLPTLTHHEAVPGHHFQASVLATSRALPLFRRIVRFSAYTEGWALYAQEVAAELGVYESDPFGRIGELQSQLFRAARIVVDTGLHHKRWTLHEAVNWMVENAGERPQSTLREVVRYSVYPGQACSFKVGANRIRAAREAAAAQMGAQFDQRAFHDLVLESGPVPLAVLESAVDQWARS
jgi:uncharacterized protein (DUF885 family)